MKLANTKQAYLKGLLLLALAANATWEPAMEGLMSLDLAREAPQEALAGSSSGSGSRDTVTVQLTASGNKGAAPSPQGVQPPPPAKSEKDGDKAHPAPAHTTKEFDQERMPPNTCVGLPLDVLYTQTTENGRPVTEIAVARRFRSGSEDILTNPIKQNGTIESIKGGSEAEKSELFAHLKSKVKAKIGSECKDEAAQITAQPAGTPEPESRRTRLSDSLKERDKKAESGRLCAKDADGKSIKNNDEKIDCLLGKIEELDTETEDGKKRSAKALMEQLEKIVRDHLKDHIIEKLTSDDKDEERDGEKLSSLVSKLVKSTGKRLKLDGYKIQKLIAELSALSAGGKTHRTAETLMAREEQLRDRYNSAYEMFQNYPTQWNAAQLNALQWQRYNLATQINQSVMPLHNLRTQGIMAADDYRTFMSPYASLSEDMLRLTNLRSLGIGPEMSAGTAGAANFAGMDIGPAPENIMSIRGGRGSSPSGRLGVRSTNAGSLPTVAPRISFGNYGSSLATRQLSPQQNVFNSQPAFGRSFSQSNFNSQPAIARPLSSPIYGGRQPMQQQQLAPATNVPFGRRF